MMACSSIMKSLELVSPFLLGHCGSIGYFGAQIDCFHTNYKVIAMDGRG